MTAAPRDTVVAAYEGLGQYDVAAAGRVVAPSLYVAVDETSPWSGIARLRALPPRILFGPTIGAGHYCQLKAPIQVNAMIDRVLAVAVAVAVAAIATPAA